MMVEPSWPACRGSGRWPMRFPGDQRGDETGGDGQVGDHRAPRAANRRRRGWWTGRRGVMTSAVSRVRSALARPIATPMVAAAMARYVVDAVTDQHDLRSELSSSRTAVTLSSGSSPARISVMPNGAASATAARVVAGEQDGSLPVRVVRAATVSAAPWRALVEDRERRRRWSRAGR